MIVFFFSLFFPLFRIYLHTHTHTRGSVRSVSPGSVPPRHHLYNPLALKTHNITHGTVYERVKYTLRVDQMSRSPGTQCATDGRGSGLFVFLSPQCTTSRPYRVLSSSYYTRFDIRTAHDVPIERVSTPKSVVRGKNCPCVADRSVISAGARQVYRSFLKHQTGRGRAIRIRVTLYVNPVELSRSCT